MWGVLVKTVHTEGTISVLECHQTYMDIGTEWLALTVLFLKTIQISLIADFYFFGIKKNVATLSLKDVGQRMAKRKVLNGNNSKSPKIYC